MITDRRKFTTKITLYEISSLHFYRWNQFKVITLDSSPYTERTPKFFGHVGCGLTTRQITLTSLSRKQPIAIDY